MHEECDFAVGTIQLYQNLIYPSFQMAVDDDIYLDEGYVDVNHQIIYRKINGVSKHRVHPPKNGCSRIVPLQEDMIQLLKKYKNATYLTSRMSEFDVEGLQNFVFLNKELRPYTPNTLTRMFHELVETQNREMDGEDDAVLLPHFQLMCYAIHTVQGWQKTDVISRCCRRLWDTKTSK